MSIEQEFRKEVQSHLSHLSSDIKPVLKQLIEYNYPEEVVSLEFEVFADGFTQGFPVMTFFMDKENSEHFIDVDGQAQYPSPVDPELLYIEHVYPDELEDKYRNKDEDIDLYTIATEELIKWFAECWNEVGGESFKLKANIAFHDDINEYNLIENRWQERF